MPVAVNLAVEISAILAALVTAYKDALAAFPGGGKADVQKLATVAQDVQNVVAAAHQKFSDPAFVSQVQAGAAVYNQMLDVVNSFGGANK